MHNFILKAWKYFDFIDYYKKVILLNYTSKLTI